MSSITPSTHGSPSSADEVARICVAMFRDMTALDDKAEGAAMTDADVLAAPLDSFDLDSLSTMEFIMAIEDRFNVLLDENAVNQCATLGQLSTLVAKEIRV